MKWTNAETARLYRSTAKMHGDLAVEWIRHGIAKGFNARTVEFSAASSARHAAHDAIRALRAEGIRT